jgi:hypothetical protein
MRCRSPPCPPGVVERVAVGQHLDGLDRVTCQRDRAGTLHVQRDLPERRLRAGRLHHVPHLQGEGTVVGGKRVVAVDVDRLGLRTWCQTDADNTRVVSADQLFRGGNFLIGQPLLSFESHTPSRLLDGQGIERNSIGVDGLMA